MYVKTRRNSRSKSFSSLRVTGKVAQTGKRRRRVCSQCSHYDYRERSTVGQQSQKIVEQKKKKINNTVVWGNVPRPVVMEVNVCLVRINISSSPRG